MSDQQQQQQRQTPPSPSQWPPLPIPASSTSGREDDEEAEVWSDEENEQWRYTSGAYYTVDDDDDDNDGGGGGESRKKNRDENNDDDDDDDDEVERLKKQLNPREQSSLISPSHAKREYKPSRQYDGKVKLKERDPPIEPPSSRYDMITTPETPRVSMPQVSKLVEEEFGGDGLLGFLWNRCLLHGTDESGLIEKSRLSDILKEIEITFGFEIALDLLGFEDVDDDDYIEFVHVAEKIAKVLPAVKPIIHIAPPKRLHFVCCSLPSCRHINAHSLGDCPQLENATTVGRELVAQAGNHQLLVAYSQFSSDQNGKMRNKHLLPIMNQAQIPYDTNRLPPSFWSLRSELLVPSFEAFEQLVETVRTDKDVERTGATGKNQPFRLPRWLKEQFTAAEILMLKHYYCNASELSMKGEEQGLPTSDVVGDAKESAALSSPSSVALHMKIPLPTKTTTTLSLRRQEAKEGKESHEAKEIKEETEAAPFEKDVARFREIIRLMGSKLSTKQARELLKRHCRVAEDQNRRRHLVFDFLSFVVIMFKVSKQSVRCRPLSSAYRDIKMKLPIFTELDEMYRNPPDHVTLLSHSGSPVVCECLLRGPRESIYRGGCFRFQITVSAGYPYLPPRVLFHTRLLSVNVITKFDGTGYLAHLPSIWDASWTLRRLIDHVTDLFVQPDLTHVPRHLLTLAATWMVHEWRRRETEEMSAAGDGAVVGDGDDVGDCHGAGDGDGDGDSNDDGACVGDGAGAKEGLGGGVVWEGKESGWREDGSKAEVQRQGVAESKEGQESERVSVRGRGVMEATDAKEVNEVKEAKDEKGGEQERAPSVPPTPRQGVAETKQGDDDSAAIQRVGSARGGDVPLSGRSGAGEGTAVIAHVPSVVEHLHAALPAGIPLDAIVQDRVSTLTDVNRAVEGLTKIERVHLRNLCQLLDPDDGGQKYVDMVMAFVERFAERDESGGFQGEGEEGWGEGEQCVAEGREESAAVDGEGGAGPGGGDAFYDICFYGYAGDAGEVVADPSETSLEGEGKADIYVDVEYDADLIGDDDDDEQGFSAKASSDAK